MPTYPMRLLPQQHYTKIGWDDSIAELYLVHFTTSKDLIDPTTRKLRASLVVKQTDHMRDYSNSLLGIFKVEDVYWAVQKCPSKDYFLKEWTPGKEVICPSVPSEFKKDDSRGYFFLKVGNCHNETIEFGEDIKPVCVFLHTPVNSNFWHISLRWYLGGKDSGDLQGSKRRLVLSSAKSFVIEKAEFIVPDHSSIESRLYEKAQ